MDQTVMEVRKDVLIKNKRDILSRSFFNFNFIIQHSDVCLKYHKDALFKGYSFLRICRIPRLN